MELKQTELSWFKCVSCSELISVALTFLSNYNYFLNAAYKNIWAGSWSTSEITSLHKWQLLNCLRSPDICDVKMGSRAKKRLGTNALRTAPSTGTGLFLSRQWSIPVFVILIPHHLHRHVDIVIQSQRVWVIKKHLSSPSHSPVME